MTVLSRHRIQHSDAITIHRSTSRHELGWWKTWGIMGSNVWGARELIWQLFKRDFLASYRKSYIGATWIFISPIAAIISWLFLQRAGILNPGDPGIPYPVYVLVGSTMWTLFMGLFSASSDTLAAGKELIMQVNYPHEALLFKQIAHKLADFVIALALNIVVLLIYGVAVSPAALLLPIVALPLAWFAAACGLVLSMLSVVAVDVTRIVNMGAAFLMYLTPIIYTDDISNELVRAIIKWNPLTHLVCSCRDILLFGRLYDLEGFAWSAILAITFLAASWRLFYIGEKRLVERMV